MKPNLRYFAKSSDPRSRAAGTKPNIPKLVYRFMRHLYKVLLCALLSVGTTALFGCQNDNGAKELAHHHDHGHEGHNHEGHDHEKHEHDHDHNHDEHNHDGHDHEGHNHDNVNDNEQHDGDAIVIEPEKAERLGIRSVETVESDFQETMKVSAEILASASDSRMISAKSSGIVTLPAGMSEGLHVAAGQSVASISRKGMPGGDEAEGARLDFEAAKREYDRLKPLFEKGVVSARDFNAARSVYERAEAALSGSRPAQSGTGASSPIAGTISAIYVKNGDYVEAGEPIAAVVANTSMRLHADLPRRLRDSYDKITSATIVVPETGKTYDIADMKGHRLAGEAIECAQHPGYLPVLFTFEGDGRLTSGGYVDAYLKLTNRHQAITVPLESLSEQQGKWFVYIRLDEDCYEKRPVERGGSDGRRVEILSGITPGEHVVTDGMAYVKLAENVGAVPGHSHTH